MNELLNMFGVSSHRELLEHIQNDPEDKKVIELKELLGSFGVVISPGVGEEDE